MMNRHLDSEAIDRWLIGERNPATGNHLGDCAVCRLKVARLESALTEFRSVTRRGSDQQPLSRPPAGWVAGSVAGGRWPAPLRWAVVAAAAFLLAALPVYREHSQRQAAAQARADALLLEEVSTDISRPAPEPLEPVMKLVLQSTTGDNR